MKTAFITGSTDGIGKETALILARKGYRILVHGRDMEKIDHTVSWIKNETQNREVAGYLADFSSLREVEKMADMIMETEPYLDVLINNAGLIMQNYALTAEEIETTFAVNHLAHFYLTGRLLPLVRKRKKTRIINLTSKIHSSAINFETFLSRNAFESVKEYSDSKLCNVLFTYTLANLLQKEGITVNCMHPGVINTKMLTKTWGPIGSPVHDGATREVYLADSPEVEGITGKYFVGNRMADSVPFSYQPEAWDALWKISLDLLSKSGFTNPYEPLILKLV